MITNRVPVVAGRFYPASESACRQMAGDLLRGVLVPPAVGAVVPHAGWVFSGSTAALSLAGIAAWEPETVVVFGAVHGPDPNAASVFGRGSWQTPLGPLNVDEELAARLVRSPLITDSPNAHQREHSIEVQLPLLRRLRPEVKIVPVSVRPGRDAPEVGRFCAAEAKRSAGRIAFIGSTDLTHYGPAFGFEPHGRGEQGICWAKDVNDRRFITLIQAMDADGVVPEADRHANACGAGAVAALLGAMKEIGGLHYQELRHTCSADCELPSERDPYNSVGYEAGIFAPAS